MIRIALVTTWGVRCGVAEHAANLVGHMKDPDIKYEIWGGPYEASLLRPKILQGHYDIVHFNYESGFLGIFSPGVARTFGNRLVITLHDHWPRNNRVGYPFTTEFDRVVIHQKSDDIYGNFRHIPQGIVPLTPQTWSPTNTTIGTAGFPLWQKRVEEVAQATALLVKETPRVTGIEMVCPESAHVDTYEMKGKVKRAFPQAVYHTAWMDQYEVMAILSKNLVNVFPYKDGKPGISASVRLGIGTGSHIVLSKCTMFEDIYNDEAYHDEVEWIEGEVTPRTIADACLRVIESGKRPKRILEDMNWTRCSQMYSDLYKEMMVK